MTLRADPALLPEIERFGAFDVNACFNCGNCTAICPLSKGDHAFPRRMIRYAQIGLPDHLVSAKELWLCHYCGDCSLTCPRQAEPGEFMAAARRYAIARFDPTGFSRVLTLSPGLALLAMLVLAVVLGAVLLAASPGFPKGPFTTELMLDYMPYEFLHWTGIGVFAFLGLVSTLTILNMGWSLAHAAVPAGAEDVDRDPGLFPAPAAWRGLRSMLVDVFGHRSFRTCATEEPGKDAGPWPLRPWFVHFSIMAGFLGLGAATALDFALKDPDLFVPIWSPIRLLGTLSGLVFVYGTTVAILRRIRRSDRPTAHSRFSDWLFLVLLWTTGVTGFAIEIAMYAGAPASAFLYVLFLVHVLLAMELLLLLPFTKFAHAVYRPLALLTHAFRTARREGRTQPA